MVAMTTSSKRTPRQRAISAAATGRAIRIARERYRRLENERVRRLESEYFEQWLKR